MKDLPGEEKHPLLSFHPDHQKQGGEQTSEGKDLADEIFYVFIVKYLLVHMIYFTSYTMKYVISLNDISEV